MSGDDKEQQLREKIASQKAAIADLPSLRSIVDETGITSPETKARAQLIKGLSDNEEQLELLLESKRVVAVVRLQDELHPPKSEDCPICLETIKHVNSKTITRFHCCSGWVCVPCADEREANCKRDGFDTLRGKCPLCRGEMYGDGADDRKKARAKVLEHSNRGMAWAQYQIGAWYSNERGKEYGFPLDEEKGLRFLKQAADQRDSDALLKIALSFFLPERDGDESKHTYYLKEAADLGHQLAQLMLSYAYKRQNDDKGRLHYITLAASQGEPNACVVLGDLFRTGGCGLAKSLILALHYYRKSLKDIEKLADGQYQYVTYYFSMALFQLGCEQYEEILEIPGHSPIPKSLFWARKALEGNSSTVANEAINIVSGLENQAKIHCANCWKEAGCSSFMRCSRCAGAWYCGKECQVQHWKAGHKLDCIKNK